MLLITFLNSSYSQMFLKSDNFLDLDMLDVYIMSIIDIVIDKGRYVEYHT